MLPDRTMFWMVYARNGTHPPAHEHHDYQAALNESQRLAREHPHTQFYVLAAVAVSVRTDVVTVDCVDPLEYGSPF